MSVAIRNHCLLIDTEFVTLKDQAPSLFQICVQAYQDPNPITNNNVPCPQEKLDNTLNRGARDRPR
jgi:hypothetical protein